MDESDWTDTKSGRVKPVYKDAILNKRDLRIALTEIWGGLAPGTVHEIDEMMRSAKAGSDATNYAHSNAAYCFKTHWTRLLGLRMMAAIGRVLCNAAPLVNAAVPLSAGVARVLIPPQDQSHLDFLWPQDDLAHAADASRANSTAGASGAAAERLTLPVQTAPTPRPRARPAHAPTPATNRVAPPSRRRRVISVTQELDTAYSETRKCANCGTACAEEYCACGMRVRRSPHHPRPRRGAGVPPDASATPAATSRRHDDIPIHLTDSASQFRMDVDCDDAPDDAPFELTELDHLTLADDYARALALADAQAQASDAYASDDSDKDSLGIDDPDLLDIPPPMTYEAWSVDEMECGAE